MPGLVTVFFSADPVRDFAGARPATRRPTAVSAGPCSTAAIYPPASQFEAWFPSLAHDEAAIEWTIEAAGRGVRAGRSDSPPL